MPKINQNLLEKLKTIITRDSPFMITNIDMLTKLTKNTEINFECIRCSIATNKTAKVLCYGDKGGLYCKSCTKIRTHEKMNQTKGVVIFDRKLLDLQILKVNAILLSFVEPLNCRSNILYICTCGEDGKKTFKDIVRESGAFCESCTLTIAKDREMESKGRDRINFNFLSQLASKCGVTFIEDYSNIKKWLWDMLVRFICSCGEVTELQFGTINSKKYISCRNCYLEVMKKNSFEKYGVEHPTQLEETKRKMKDTCLELYGVEHVAHSSEFQEKMEKHSYSYKDYHMPSGEIRRVQGYEPFALDELIYRGILEADIKTQYKDKPQIQWKDEEGNTHIYNVDIFIPILNLMIEVKSHGWTYDRIERKKGEACKNAGYQFEVWVYNHKGERVTTDIY